MARIAKRTYARKRTGTRKAKTAIRKAVRKVSTRIFNQRVKRVLYRNSETKIVNYSVLSKPIYNVASADWSGSVMNLLPQTAGSAVTMYTISQGDTQGGREGNYISPVSLVLTGVIRANIQYDTNLNYNPCPLRVTMWVVSVPKHLTDSVGELESIVDNTFFQNGSVAVGFTGTTVDLTRTPNREQIRVHKKRTFLVGAGNYVSAFATGSAANVNQQYNNNDASLSRMFRINLSKSLPKRLSFNDGTDTPSNVRKMYIFFTTSRVDGTVSATSGGSFTGPIPAYVDMGCQLTYKDL